MLDSIDNMEYAIDNFFSGNISLQRNQEKFMEHLGIVFDGKAHKRVIDGVLEVLSK